MTQEAELFGLTHDLEIELFKLDLSPVKQPVLYLTNHTNYGETLQWNGQPYQPFPLNFSGGSLTSQETTESASLSITDFNPTLVSQLRKFQGLVGCKLTRTVIFFNQLDFQENSSQNEPIHSSLWKITRPQYNLLQIQWELRRSTYLGNIELPRRILTSKVCTSEYRGVLCGYTGASMFNADNVRVTNPLEDLCNHNQSGCNIRKNYARFGAIVGLSRE